MASEHTTITRLPGQRLATTMGLVLGLSSLVTGTVLAEDGPPAAAPAQPLAVVSVPRANLRAGPSLAHQIVASLERNQQFAVTSRQGTWLYGRPLELVDSGWVATRFLQALTSGKGSSMQVTADVLNVRGSAAMSGQVVRRLFRGMHVGLIEEQGGWTHVALPALGAVYLRSDLAYTTGPEAPLVQPAANDTAATVAASAQPRRRPTRQRSGRRAPRTSLQKARVILADAKSRRHFQEGELNRARAYAAAALLEGAPSARQARSLLIQIDKLQRLANAYRQALEPINRFFAPLPPRPGLLVGLKTPGDDRAAPKANVTLAANATICEETRTAASLRIAPQADTAQVGRPPATDG